MAKEPLHGYAMLSRITELSDGRLKLAVGTLYGIIDRLAEQKLIELDREEVIDSRLRRYYRLTDLGRHTFREEGARQATNARIAASQLAGVVLRPHRGEP